MKYSMPIRVRYSETNKYGYTDLHKILEYFQDCSIFHSESLGYRVQEELEINRGWFLLAWDVKIRRYPSMGQELKVVTEPYKMKGFYGYRRFWLLDDQGMPLVSADSLWMLMDLKKMLPWRVPEEMTRAYVSGVTDDSVRIKRKLPDRGDWEETGKIRVGKHYLDSNSHVNNTFYAMWAEECIPPGFRTAGLKIDYRQSSFENDVITIDRIIETDKVRCRFRNQEEKLICLVELYEQTEETS